MFAIWAAAWRFKKQAHDPNRRIQCIWLFPGVSKVRFHTVFIDKPGLRLKRKCCFPQVFHRGLQERISTPCPTCRWRRDALVAQRWKSKAFLHGMVVDSFLKAIFEKQAHDRNRRIPCIWLFPGASKVRFHMVFIDKPGLRTPALRG